MDGFEIAAGSVQGGDHVKTGLNNQDAMTICGSDSHIVGIVCDGCSGGSHAEVGAKIGARLFAKHISRLVPKIGPPLGKRAGDLGTSPDSIHRYYSERLEQARMKVLTEIEGIAGTMAGEGQSFEDIIGKYFLFTIVGFVIDVDRTIVFSIGDGYYSISSDNEAHPDSDGTTIETLHQAKNMPAYFAYDILGPMKAFPKESLRFAIQESVPTKSLNHVFVGTDGLEYLVGKEDEPLPGKSKKIGPISQFWTDDSVFKNGDIIRRRLSLMNFDAKTRDRETKEIRLHPSILKDDTTLISIRKKECQQS
jgi:hypothetical protein